MNLKKLVVGLVALVAFLVVPLTTARSAQDTKGKVTVSEDNVLVVAGVIDDKSMGEILFQARKLDEKLSKKELFGLKEKKPLYVFLYTPGGSIQTGLETIEALRGLGRPIHTVTLFAASMGFQLAQNLDKRYVLNNGILMSHRAAGGEEGSFGGQAPSQLQNRLGLWERRMKELDEHTVARTGGKQTYESYIKAYSDELWLTGAEAVNAGYADEVVTIHCDKSLNGVTTHSVTLMGIINVDYDLDKCPINTSPMNIRVSIISNKGKIPLNEFTAKGGSFDAGCMYSAGDKLCAIKPGFSVTEVEDLVNKFKESYHLDHTKALPYTN